MNRMTATIKREWLARIIDGSKRIEYRDNTDYWAKKVDRVGRPPFEFRLINGMSPDSPEAVVLVRHVDISILDDQIRFHIDRVLSTLRWNSEWQKNYPPIAEEPEVPQLNRISAGPPEVTLTVLPELLEKISSPGPHGFQLPLDEEAMISLGKQPLEPYLLRLSANHDTIDVIVYAIYLHYFECVADFTVVTPVP